MTAFFIFAIIIPECGVLLLILENEFLENLGNKINVICSKCHGFGTDAILLANFAQCKKIDISCDLGTGCGIIPLLWCSNNLGESIVAVDIQKQATSQLSRAVQLNNLEDKITVINSDLKELKGKLNFGSFNLVTMNPPYKKVNTGIINNATSEQIARHEIMCDIYDICNCANKLLQFGGRLCMCNRPERLCDVIDAMKKSNIEPKKLRFVAKNSSSKPWLFLIEGKKGSKPYLDILPTLNIQDENGNDSKELLKIIGNYREK